MSPCSKDVKIGWFLSLSFVLIKTPVPSEETSVFSLTLSAITFPTTFQLVPSVLKADKSFKLTSLKGKNSMGASSSTGVAIMTSGTSFLQEAKRQIVSAIKQFNVVVYFISKYLLFLKFIWYRLILLAFCKKRLIMSIHKMILNYLMYCIFLFIWFLIYMGI